MKMVREATLFLGVGFIGFLVDAGVLFVLSPHIGPFIGRGFSFFFAVITTWLLNRSLTFKGRSSGLQKDKEFLAYFLLMLIGGTVNYLVFTWLVLSYSFIERNLFVGVAAGSLAGMFFNFTSSRASLFRRT